MQAYIKTAHYIMNKTRKLDQFYTKDCVVDYCLDILYNSIDMSNNYTYIEPSAGQGAFFDKLYYPKIGIDIDSNRSDILKNNFLKYIPKINKKIICIGNPPFGKNSSLAVKFFNHSANFSDIIAFILPRTFLKSSIINKLDKNMHLVSSNILDKNSFLYESIEYDVPTVFQIWKKDSLIRENLSEIKYHEDFIFTTYDEGDFAFQRVGANAGKCSLEGLTKSKNSHYFIKNLNSINVKDILASIDWDKVKYNTVGNPSISKSELVKLYNEKINNDNSKS